MKTEEEIDDIIDRWHEGEGPDTLHEFLGWTLEEYRHWVETGEQPE